MLCYVMLLYYLNVRQGGENSQRDERVDLRDDWSESYNRIVCYGIIHNTTICDVMFFVCFFLSRIWWICLMYCNNHRLMSFIHVKVWDSNARI